MSMEKALEILKNYIKCYDHENIGCDYNCEKCGLDISHEELIEAVRMVVDAHCH